MANEVQKKQALDSIRENIARTGLHIYVVSGEQTPRFAYSIGVSESIGVELILAGAIFYSSEEVIQIVNNVAAQLKVQKDRQAFEVAGRGLFSLRRAHSSWATELMLGACDYYQKQEIPAVQIVPDNAHWTIDVPDMSLPRNATTEPVWRWLDEPWNYPVPENSNAATNLAALRGDRITEVMRWEEDEWEVFAGAGPDVPKGDVRLVPLGTLLAADESMVPAVHVAIGEGLWRDPDRKSEWHPWRKRDDATTTRTPE
jgi:Domain of unknown function (DUF4262)